MSAVIKAAETDALVDYFGSVLRENIESGELTLPTDDDELRAVAAASVASIVQAQRRLSDRFGRFFTSETACEALLGITRQALKSRVDNNRLLRVETADGKKVYPEVQFDGAGSVVQGLPKILQTLLPAAADEWTVLYWLTAPLPEYSNRTAVDVLRGGDRHEAKAILKMAKDDASVWQDISHGDG
ncbi:hypothetical protein [Microbacterium sp.]|uniref:hypothetical protein n=1 Tax=Microbacterium sp. TaxID=51671 RepID=UPI000CAEE65E|nr:hypothetical protein CTI14_10230 [Methylobacterium radiotolerans]